MFVLGERFFMATASCRMIGLVRTTIEDPHRHISRQGNHSTLPTEETAQSQT
jgi:hypothetical protein